jgi:hypothetical protein
VTTKTGYQYKFKLDIGRGDPYIKIFNVTDFGYDPDDWDKLNKFDQEKVLDVSLDAWMSDYLDYSWSQL